MSIHFKLISDKNPQDVTNTREDKKQAIAGDEKKLREISHRIASHSAMNTPDVYGVLMALEEEIIAALKGGENVELWLYTYFTPRYKIKGFIKRLDSMLRCLFSGRQLSIDSEQK